MSGVTIREAAEADLDALATLYAGLGTLGADYRDRLREAFRRLAAYPSYHVLLAESGGVAVGTYALLIADTLGNRCRPEGLVEDVVVAPESRGLGVGRLMMEDAMRRCRDAGCYKLVLSSNLSRPDAHAFYESLGFRRHGVSFLVEFDREGDQP